MKIFLDKTNFIEFKQYNIRIKYKMWIMLK